MLPHGALITSYLSGMHWAGMKSSDRGICRSISFMPVA